MCTNRTSRPPITQLIENTGIKRVVIGAPHPIPQLASEGAATLHSAGIAVTMGVEQDKCDEIIASYKELVKGRIHKVARNHLAKNKRVSKSYKTNLPCLFDESIFVFFFMKLIVKNLIRQEYDQIHFVCPSIQPLGLLHCSVIDSMDATAFARNGNSFGKDFGGGTILSMRDFGAYEIAPPPESIWAALEESNWETEGDMDAFFYEEDEDEEELKSNPIMPWYNQVDAVISTFPKEGYGPLDDDSIMGRLRGLKWLATQGKSLPSGVERILVMDATDLPNLPLSNDDPNLPPGVNVEEFWRGEGRKATRVLLRFSANALAAAAADSAAGTLSWIQLLYYLSLVAHSYHSFAILYFVVCVLK